MDSHHEFKGLLHYQSPQASSIQNQVTLSPTTKPYSSSLTNINMHSIESSTNYATTICHQNSPPILDPTSSSSNTFYNRFLSNSLFHVPFHLFSPTTPSNNSLIEPREIQIESLISSDQKRIRRMQSNRESARRSRMRRKKQIEELQANVTQLQSMNHQLSEKVIHLLETNHQILNENSQLKEKVASLHLFMANILNPIENVEDSHIKGETSDRSIVHQ